MIQANELRVGNLLNYDTGEEEGIVTTTIDHEDVWECGRRNVRFNKNHSPIPITEEWLLRLGFASDCYNDRYYIKGAKYQIECDKISGETFLWIDGAPHVKSIHDLQNYHFALTGEELKLQGK